MISYIETAGLGGPELGGAGAVGDMASGASSLFSSLFSSAGGSSTANVVTNQQLDFEAQQAHQSQVMWLVAGFSVLAIAGVSYYLLK